MDAQTREAQRQQTSRRRLAPQVPQRIHFPAAGLGEWVESTGQSSLELHVEATDSAGGLAVWLTDEWWIRIQGLSKKRRVTIVILPTPGALLNEVVLHQLEMVRRIAPRWRLIGYAPTGDLAVHTSTERWLHTPYDEIRFCELCESDRQKADAAQRLADQVAASPTNRPGPPLTRVRPRVNPPLGLAPHPPGLAEEHSQRA